MKKFIELSDEVLARLNSGKCVEGSLHCDQRTGRVTFKAYNRQRIGGREADRLLYRSTNGWLRASKERHKLWVSVTRDVGLCRGAASLLAEAREICDWMFNQGWEDGEDV